MFHSRNSISIITSKMKAFSLEKVLKSSSGAQGRLGCLQLPAPSTVNGEKNEPGRGENSDPPSERDERVAYRTPMYIIHTQTGTVPHITPEVFKLIYPTASGASDVSGSVPPLQISVDSTLKFAESLEKFEKGIGKFVGFSDLPIFLTIHDPLQALRCGHNDKFGVALWSRHGRNGLTSERFAGMLKSYKCGLSQIISDYDIHPGVSGVKRLQKSLVRAEEYTSYVLKQQSKDGRKQTGLFITVEVDWFKMNEEFAKKTVLKLMENRHEIEGVVVSGISKRFIKGSKEKTIESKNKNAKNEERLDVCEDLEESLEVVEKIVDVLPSNLPKYAPGPFKLVQIVDLLAKGIDIFDSSVASRMADNAEAFLLDEVEAKLPLLSNSVDKLPSSVNESLPERPSADEEGPDGHGENLNPPEKPVISLKNKRYFDDFGPISKTCTCYTCRKHTRSYVHHLYATDELLGPVLIQMHNLTALDRFFKIMRAIINDSVTTEALQERFDLIKKLISSDDEQSSESENDDENEVKVSVSRNNTS